MLNVRDLKVIFNVLGMTLPFIHLIGIHFYKNKNQDGKGKKSGTSIRKHWKRHSDSWEKAQDHCSIDKKVNK